MIAIYGKQTGMKRFLPMDYADGTLVSRRIYMTTWPREEYAHVRSLVEYMSKFNPDFTFEIRKVS